MNTGTNFFVSKEKAIEFYADYGFTSKDIEEKIKTQEIKIGKPPVLSNQTLFLTDNDSRYVIING